MKEGDFNNKTLNAYNDDDDDDDDYDARWGETEYE